jgi:hypothetical protein
MRTQAIKNVLLAAALFSLPAFQYVVPRSVMRLIHRFPKPTWIENLAVRSNGDVIVTLLSAPELHLISPLASPPKQSLIHSFQGTPNITGLLGITEIDQDVFAFVAGNASQPGSYSVWQANFRRRGDQRAAATISKVVDVPSAGLLNGMTTLKANTVLIADSMAGNIVKLCTQTKQAEVIIDDVTMKPGVSGSFSPGINAIKLLGSFLYYTNTFTGNLHRVEIDTGTGEAVGEVKTIASLGDIDDFAVGRDGTIYVTDGVSHIIVEVTPGGQHRTFAGGPNSIGMAGPTAAAIGRMEKDANTLYVVTNGGFKAPINGTMTTGGSLIAISL